jgi:anti-sigma factor RsiW
MTCKEFEELSGAYVLGAVTAEEREAAQLHLAQCKACARLYQELRSVVALLPLSVPQITPPATLEPRVFAAIRREADTSARSAQHVQTVTPEPQQRRKTGWVTRLLAAAAVLLFMLLVGLSLLAYSLENQLTSTGQRVISIGQQLANTKQQLITIEQQLASVSPRQMATITGTAVVKGATGELFYLPQQNMTLLVVHGLPQLQGRHVYQGWLLLVQGKKIMSIKSVGLLTIQGNTASVSFPGNVISYNTAAISREPGPAPSLKVPAGPVVATGSVKD